MCILPTLQSKLYRPSHSSVSTDGFLSFCCVWAVLFLSFSLIFIESFPALAHSQHTINTWTFPHFLLDLTIINRLNYFIMLAQLTLDCCCSCSVTFFWFQWNCHVSFTMFLFVWRLPVCAYETGTFQMEMCDVTDAKNFPSANGMINFM